MLPRVTAILVIRDGERHLSRTLDALNNQTRRPDGLVIVDCAPSEASRAPIEHAGASHIVSASGDLAYGEAVEVALRSVDAVEGELLWLLAQDTAPEPGALQALVATLEIAPSVAVAGPKLMHWDEPDYIAELGQSITQFGATVRLVHDELDQAQHDLSSDVMAVAPAGLLVRREVWSALGGFDPALPVVDDGLDLGIRTRLAGHRVVVVPSARVAYAGDGVVGPVASLRGRARRRRLRIARTAQLHRRLTYAPAPAVPLHWLTLLPLAIVRSVWHLLAKSPGAIIGEFAAALQVMFTPARVAAARRQLNRTKRSGWAALAPLRVPADEMRRRRALAREARIARAKGERNEIRFFAAGGGWTVLVAAAVGVILLIPLLGASGITGGGLAALSATPAELWHNTGYGWRDVGAGFVGAADPFASVLAVLGSLTAWAPSFSLLLLWFLALPLAALGAWLAASRLTDSGGIRAVAGILWAVSPPLIAAIAEGRPASVIAHVLLPWLFFTGYAATRSWAASAATSLLFAAVVACAPSLAPALLLIWLVCVLASGRRVMRFVGIPIPALALALPLIWEQVRSGTPLALLADPGWPVVATPASAPSLVLGFPAAGLGGWPELLAQVLPGVEARWVVVGLLAPIAILALLALFIRGSRTAAFALSAALLGFLTAVGTTMLVVATLGSQNVAIWPGAGLSLYWLGLTGAIVIALRGIRRLAAIPGTIVALAAIGVVVPLGATVAAGEAAIRPAPERTMPAFVAAEAENDPRVTTLQLTPQPDGGILASLQRGTGQTLDDQSTLQQTRRDLPATDARLADIAGNLASRSGLDSEAALDDLGVRFVLLTPPASTVNGEPAPAGVVTGNRATLALDGNAALVAVGETDFGRLWRTDTAVSDASAAAAIPADAGGWMRGAVFLMQGIVFGATLLLSIPTGAGREIPPRRRRVVAESPGETPDPSGEPSDAPEGLESDTIELAAPDELPSAPEPTAEHVAQADSTVSPDAPAEGAVEGADGEADARDENGSDERRSDENGSDERRGDDDGR